MQQTFQHLRTGSKADPFLWKGIDTVGHNKQAQSHIKLIRYQEQLAAHRIAESWQHQRHNG